jgi:hypothetical protein
MGGALLGAGALAGTLTAGGNWYDDSIYAPLSAVADLNGDRYALPEADDLGITNIDLNTTPTWGANILTNGDFATNSDWTGTNWTISGGVATHTAGNTAVFTHSPALSLVAGTAYRVSVTISGRTAGTIQPSLTGGTTVTGSANGNANGTHVWVMVAATGNNGFRFAPSSDFDGSIDNATVEPCTNDAAFGDINLGNGWSISGGTLNKAVSSSTSGSIATFALPTAAAIDEVYQLVFTLSNYSGSGSITPTITGGATINGTAISANGTYTQIFKATAAHTAIGWSSAVTAAFSIDGVSVKKLDLTPVGRTYGAELLDNGDFSGAAQVAPDYGLGWVMKTPAVGTEAMTISGGFLRLTGDNANSPWADQSFTTVSGTSYELTFSVSNSSNALVTVGTTQGGTDVLNTPPTGYTYTGGTYTLKFTATSTTSWLRIARITASTTLMLIDNVSIKEITSLGTYPKRSATFAEFFAYTAASTGTRTYVENGGTLRTMQYGFNMFPYSRNINTWSSGSGTTVTPDATTAPDGTMTADKVIETATNAVHHISQNSTPPFSTTQTFSIYAKAAEKSRVQFTYSGSSSYWETNTPVAIFDLTTGVASGVPAGVTASSVNAGSGWWRLILTATTNVSTSTHGFRISLLGAADALSYLGDGTSGVYLWGAQWEIGSSATAIQHTNGAEGGVNAPRWGYANGKRQLRLENAGTNLCLRSQEFDLAATWNNNATTVSADAIAAPDGTTTADSIIASGASPYKYQNITGITTGTTVTASVYAKAGDVDHLSFSMGSAANYVHATFLLTGAGSITQTLNANWAAPTVSIVSVGNGWYRCVLTFVLSGGSSSAGFILSPVPTGTPTIGAAGVTTSGVSGNDLYLWGAQLEASAFASNYIPTSNATATRLIETCRLSPELEAILGRAAASVVARVDLSGTGAMAIVGAGTTGSYISTTAVANKVNTWTASNLESTMGSGTTTDPLGAATAFDIAGRSVVSNGGTVASDTTPTTLRTHAYLARTDSNSSLPYGPGHYDFIGISPERLPDATLQALAIAA